MKKKLITLLALPLLYAAGAQAQTMTVRMLGGETHQFPTAEIEEVSFELPANEDGPFDIEVSEITAVSARLTVTPDDPGLRYYFDVCTGERYERFGAKSIVEAYFASLLNEYPGIPLSTFLDGSLSQGADEDVVQGLPSDTEMVCFAIGVDDDGKCVGEASAVPFRTLAGGDPAECRFEISCTGLQSTAFTVCVKPTDPTVHYWMGVYAATQWPGDATMPMLVKNTIDEYVGSSSMSLEEVVDGVTFTGEIMENESGFEPSTPYYIYVYAMDAQGNAAGPLFKERVTTTAYDYSDASVSLSYRYFDGDELAAAYPDRFSTAAGRVLVQPVFTPNAYAYNYVWAFAAGDLTDDQVYPDDPTKSAVLQGGYLNVPTKNLYAQWGEATFLYFASDASGLDGHLSRTYVDLKPEGASPASAYSDIESASTEGPARLKLVPRADGSDNFRITTRLRRVTEVPALYRSAF